MPAPFASDRSWRFDVGPEELWDTISHTERFPTWWSWLHRFESDGLHEGTVARLEVRPPLPYSLNLTISVERVEPCRLVDTVVGGDLFGPARLEVEPDGDGSLARLTWSLEPRNRLLRGMARVARPVMVWGHDRVLELGVSQFRRRGLSGGA